MVDVDINQSLVENGPFKIPKSNFQRLNYWYYRYFIYQKEKKKKKSTMTLDITDRT